MAVGSMRHRVTLQTETQSADGAGGYTLGWADSLVVWADITPHDGHKIYTAGHLEARVTHDMQIRYQPNVTTDMRAVCEGRIFNIHAVIDPEQRKHFLKLLVEEGAPV